MNKKDFYFELPEKFIAQYPLANRSDSRLLAYNRKTGSLSHQQFKDLTSFLEPSDLLVLNNSKVIPARLYGNKASGGRVELLIERITGASTFLAHIKTSKAPKIGSTLNLDKGWQIEIDKRFDELYHCRAEAEVELMLSQIGHIPLPPYIRRLDEALDRERYQTIYALHKGSVAAPTAGLHFDEQLLQKIKDKGVNLAYSTLHVGAGTFRPLRCEALKDHKMHSEQFIVSDALARAVNNTRAAGKRVIAVGTTALRSLESAAIEGVLKPCSRDTDIFIYPGYQFQICDGLITNFHLPESTLIMLVSAFIGYKEAMALYQEAIKEEYRFFSYGDASFLF